MIVKEIKSIWWYKLNGLTRYALAHCASKFIPLYIVNEYPKSGGSWLAQMLSESLDIPFPRNRLPMLRSSVLHEHMMHSWNVSNILIMWRDGRDILVSQYYHSLFFNEKGNKILVEKSRSDLGFDDYNNIEGNLPAFMDYVYESKVHPRMSWSDFFSRWDGRNECTYVKYEELIDNPHKALKRVLIELADVELDEKKINEVVSKFSFKNLTGRGTGEEKKNSFLRKGVVGDWKNHFSEESRVKFKGYAGDILIKLGYEKDDSWVK